jgi:PTH2 family peptidyl-tRNA hydrolase
MLTRLLPSTGKIAAQCGHATLACFKSISKAARAAGPSSPAARLLQRWEHHGQAKVALQTKSADEMHELMAKARSLGITAEVIADAGRTQIDPGSLTVLGVGPAPKSAVDQVTGHLKLL